MAERYNRQKTLKRYGRWTVLDTEQAGPYLTCVCDCGNRADVRRDKLRYGYSKSCGCLPKDQLAGNKFPDLAPTHDTEATPGAKFGRWTILKDPESGKHPTALCRCECGIERDVLVEHLLNKRSKSCGCLRRDGARAMQLGD